MFRPNLSNRGYILEDEVPETPEIGRQGGTPSLPIRAPQPQSIGSSHEPQHLVLVEYRVARPIFGSRFLSMGVLLIRESDLYSDLVEAIKGKGSNWGYVPRDRKVRRIAVRWEIGQAVDNTLYDTVCSPAVAMKRFIRMMRERQWKDRLVVEFHAEEDLSGVVGAPRSGREASPILGEPEEEDGESSVLSLLRDYELEEVE
ncbi:hypothetical protein DSL72_001132 [Monilinia vaccinii-corymbosi]|uniref:Uncharacterized protein n=1 Tax=Monilinia vaccinii-corymbosi TaxID=61207 RepID=A0A8A3P0Z5_9HELO|nr:hypothetical protein DSL72_001132 [Monilinia vaccinii-corymbosi]